MGNTIKKELSDEVYYNEIKKQPYLCDNQLFNSKNIIKLYKYNKFKTINFIIERIREQIKPDYENKETMRRVNIMIGILSEKYDKIRTMKKYNVISYIIDDIIYTMEKEKIKMLPILLEINDIHNFYEKYNYQLIVEKIFFHSIRYEKINIELNEEEENKIYQYLDNNYFFVDKLNVTNYLISEYSRKNHVNINILDKMIKKIDTAKFVDIKNDLKHIYPVEKINMGLNEDEKCLNYLIDNCDMLLFINDKYINKLMAYRNIYNNKKFIDKYIPIYLSYIFTPRKEEILFMSIKNNLFRLTTKLLQNNISLNNNSKDFILEIKNNNDELLKKIDCKNNN